MLISRGEAKARGLKEYISGNACRYGHVERYTNCGHCCECTRIRTRHRNATPRHKEQRTIWQRGRDRESPRRTLARAIRHAVRRCPTENPARLNQLVAMWESQTGKCALSGILMIWGTRVSPISISMDRIDSTKGYSIDNLRLICQAFNMFRGQMSDDEMDAMIDARIAYRSK